MAEEKESGKKVKQASNAKELKKQPKPSVGASGFTETLRKVAATLVVHRTPEVTRFMVNVKSVLRVALNFEHAVRYEKPGHSGHPVNHLYSAYFVWAVLSKLYAVGRHTRQLHGFGENFTPEYPNAVLPATLAVLIDTLGEYEDRQTKIMVSPRVTVGLLSYLSSLSAWLVGTPYVAEDDPNAVDPDAHRGYIQYCYGDALQISVCWRAFALGNAAVVPMPEGMEEDHIRVTVAREVAAAQVAAGQGGNGVALTANQIALVGGLVSPSFLYDVANNALVGIAPAAAHPYMTPARRAALLAVQGRWVSPRVVGFAVYGQGNNLGACPIARTAFMNIAQWFQKVYVTKELSASHTGSSSSVVISTTRGHFTSLSCVSPATAEEMLFGCLWGHDHTVLLDGDDHVMNLNDVQRNTPPFSTSDFDATPGKLLVASLFESKHARKESEH